MSQKHRRRKHLKPDQRAKIWTHKIKDAALSFIGQGLAQTLRGLPRRAVSNDDLQSWLSAPASSAAFEALARRLKAHSEDERPKSVSEADGFALFALTKAIGATTALEIGTHLGYSTLYIAAALSSPPLSGPRLSGGVALAKLNTVDIVDVNDEVAAHYKTFGASISARQRLRALGLADRVEFVIGPSEPFLKRSPDTYDLIFVDGNHSEAGAYFDIISSLPRLSERGIIVLHDFNNPDDPTPGIAAGEYGVHWALHRLRSYIPDCHAIQLRTITLPGATSPVPTSLAVITRR